MTLAGPPSLCPCWVSAGQPAVVAPRPERAKGTAERAVQRSLRLSRSCALVSARVFGSLLKNPLPGTEGMQNFFRGGGWALIS